jgi:hypothetical protein
MGNGTVTRSWGHGGVAAEIRARSPESGWKLRSLIEAEAMKKRKDPPGYPGDDRITQRCNDLKKMVREEQGLSEAELEHMMRSTYEDAVCTYAPIPRAIGMPCARSGS